MRRGMRLRILLIALLVFVSANHVFGQCAGNELAGIASIRITASGGSGLIEKSFTFTSDRGPSGTIACGSVATATSGYVNRFLVRFVGTTFGEQFRVKFGSKANLVPGHYCNATDTVTGALTSLSSAIPVIPFDLT